jgi:ABC-2 type transport system permease protein
MTFSAIFRYEMKAWLRKPAFYLIAGSCYIIPLFLFIGTGGYFDGNIVEETNTLLFLNSPFQIISFIHLIGKFLLLLVPAIIGTTIYKDFQHDVISLFYSYPIGKGTYLSAKFTSSFLLVCFLSLLPLLAFISGEMVLGEGNPYITSTSLSGYIFSYCFIILPNLFVFGLLVFSVVVLFRNIYAGFLVVLLLISFQGLIENLFHQSPFLVALLDPFGQYASLDQTRYWTVTEKNQLSLGIKWILIYNRILWLGVGISSGFITYRTFSLSQFGIDFSFLRKGENKKRQGTKKHDYGKVTLFRPKGGPTQTLFQLYTMVRYKVSYVLRHWVFISFALTGMLLMIFMLNRVLYSGDLTMLPITRLILQIPALFYMMLVVFGTFIFSGMLTLLEKDSGMEPLIYSTSVPTSAIVLSKAASLILIQFVLLFIFMGAGISMQIFNGYFHFEFSQYFFSLFIVHAPVLAVWALLSVFVFSVTRSLYTGLFILVMAWLAQFGYEQMGIISKLLQFNTYPLLEYSDFNGYGAFLTGRIVLQIYWFLWGIILLLVAIMVWPRVQMDSIKLKWRAFIHTSGKKRLAFPGFLFLPLIMVSYIIFEAETSIYRVNESQKLVSEFKEKFHVLNDLPQPRISSVSLHVDLYPEKHDFILEGEYVLVNRTDMPIDTILIKTSMDEITEYKLETSGREIDSFPPLNFHLTQLSSSLMPGDSIRIYFTVKSRPNTLFQRNSGVLANGTFLTQDILPGIGYFLGQDQQSPDSSSLVNNHYQSRDSDLVSYRATVSTPADHVAFTNGSLINDWQENGRNYFSYETTKPVKFNFHFNSGKFDTYTDYWNDTLIRIYHHPGHTQNLDAIASGVKASLEFNHNLFGYAPSEGEINVIEYPLSEGSFSTLKSNTIIMSELVFGVNTDQADKINLPFYVAAHEMTHHWFGNMLIPKDAPGALFLTESITEYLTLQIFKERYGEDAARNFLNVQHERYFRGRANEQGEEKSLVLVEQGQDYISYGKGAAALNAIAQMVGQDKFHGYLAEFFKEYAESNSYPTSLNFFEILEQKTPDSLAFIIEENLIRSITYNLEIISAELEREGDNNWLVEVKYIVKPYELNKPVDRVHHRPVELGIYDIEGDLLYLAPIFENEDQRTIRIETQAKPHELVLDPNYLILDRERNNNIFSID